VVGVIVEDMVEDIVEDIVEDTVGDIPVVGVGDILEEEEIVEGGRVGVEVEILGGFR
jgi:hypothetical protein